MKAALEAAVNGRRFKMGELMSVLLPRLEEYTPMTAHLALLKRGLGDARYRKLVAGIVRHVFLIELVNRPKIETTRVRVRWCNELRDDPRGCSYEECGDIAGDLVGTLASGWLDEDAHATALDLFLKCGVLPYELPLDYATVPTTRSPGRLHARRNIVWVCNDTILRTLHLRSFVTSASSNPDSGFFKKVLNDKIKIKTYLTDRALTGPYKTNREKRWETHPFSVQFATRRDALDIEYTLITQLCRFEGFPSATQKVLQEERVLPAVLEVFRCPITLDPLSFPAFHEELMSPRAGKSRFQVGHLNPLKLDEPAAAASGHTASNIGWISEDGNRIQGSLSLADVRVLLHRIAQNYQAAGLP